MNNTTLQPGNISTPERRDPNRALIWGAILLGLGVLTFVMNLGFFDNVASFFWALAFGGGGLIFFYFFLRNTQGSWWAAIPAFALFGLAGTITVTEYAPARIASLGGAVFLGGLALGFLAIYFVRRDFWWALIPGGVLTSLAATTAAETGLTGNSDLGGGIFMLGMGLTFLLVALLPDEQGKGRWWALIPSAVLLIMGVLLLFSATQYMAYMGYVWGAVMVIAGGALLYKALGQRER